MRSSRSISATRGGPCCRAAVPRATSTARTGRTCPRRRAPDCRTTNTRGGAPGAETCSAGRPRRERRRCTATGCRAGRPSRTSPATGSSRRASHSPLTAATTSRASRRDPRSTPSTRSSAAGPARRAPTSRGRGCSWTSAATGSTRDPGDGSLT